MQSTITQRTEIRAALAALGYSSDVACLVIPTLGYACVIVDGHRREYDFVRHEFVE
jgi:hypothetical protein